ncbi:MAG: DUF1538 domain-containing protein [Methanosarcina barkeri]|nr:DUF1538 domain-containing protein [Methanosarcina sp. ERenArc_MAG2]
MSNGILSIFFEVIQSLVPLAIFFTVFQKLYLKLPSSQLIKFYIGLIFTLFGMTLFLHGVYSGFQPVGQEIGEFFGSSDKQTFLLPISFILGVLSTFAEPSVRVLCYQVETSSNGSIRANLMLYTLSFAVGILVVIAMVKIIYGIPFLYIIIPAFLFVLVLLWLCDKDFIGVSFDAGGVATGPMAVTFLMSMAVGVASVQEGGNAAIDGFGLISMIALAPIIFVMLLGVYIRFNGGRNDVR